MNRPKPDQLGDLRDREQAAHAAWREAATAAYHARGRHDATRKSATTMETWQLVELSDPKLRAAAEKATAREQQTAQALAEARAAIENLRRG